PESVRHFGGRRLTESGPSVPFLSRRRGLSASRGRSGGSGERLLGEVPEYQGVGGLDEAPAFADLAKFYRRQAKSFGELGDVGAGAGRVAGDEDHASALNIGHLRGESLGGKLVEGLHDLDTGQDVGDVVRG